MADEEKRSFLDTLIDGFFETSWKDMGNHVLNDLLKPMLKNGFYDVVTEALRFKLWGNKNGGPIKDQKRMIGGRDGSFATPVPQASASSSPFGGKVAEPPVNIGLFADMKSARMVMDEFMGSIREKGYATVPEFCKLCGKENVYTYNNFGWLSIMSTPKGIDPDKPFSTCNIRQRENGQWALIVPKPVFIDSNEQ